MTKIVFSTGNSSISWIRPANNCLQLETIHQERARQKVQVVDGQCQSALDIVSAQPLVASPSRRII